jgi:hypothetical protein
MVRLEVVRLQLGDVRFVPKADISDFDAELIQQVS